MPISSFIVECFQGKTEQVLSVLETIPVYTILGCEQHKIAVLSDTNTLDEEYQACKRVVDDGGVREINILFHNFEDVHNSPQNPNQRSQGGC